MVAPLLVIGATGQIGRNILRQTDDRPVVGLTRRPEKSGGRDSFKQVAFDLDQPLPALAEDWPAAAIATVPMSAIGMPKPGTSVSNRNKAPATKIIAASINESVGICPAASDC